MKRIVLAGATLLALTAAQPAVAQPMPAYNWTGLYIGVQGGYAFGNSIHCDSSGFCSNRYTINGGVLGGTLGYNWQMGGLVVGVETDLSWANITGSTVSSAAYDCSFGPAVCRTDVNWFGTARLRAGPAFGQVLPYVTAGLAYARLYGEISGRSATATKASWTGGAGVEFAINRSWSVKMEYLWISDLGSFNIGPPPNCTGPCTVRDAQFSVVRVGANWRF